MKPGDKFSLPDGRTVTFVGYNINGPGGGFLEVPQNEGWRGDNRLSFITPDKHYWWINAHHIKFLNFKGITLTPINRRKINLRPNPC